jgi:hypothetical protein
MVLIPHNLPFGSVKIRLWYSRWTMFQGIRGPWKIFCDSWALKKATMSKSFKWCLSRRMVWRTHYLPPVRLKKRLCWSRWSDVWRCQKTMRNNFLHSAHRAIFTESLKWCFNLMNGPENSKSESGRVKKNIKSLKRCFKVSRAMRNHILHSGHRKKLHWLYRLSDVLSRRMALRTDNMTTGRLRKRT